MLHHNLEKVILLLEIQFIYLIHYNILNILQIKIFKIIYY